MYDLTVCVLAAVAFVVAYFVVSAIVRSHEKDFD